MLDSEPPFDISTREFGDRLVVVLSGEVDLATSPEVEAAAVAPLRAGRHVVLDLREVDFLDSCGIRAVVQCRRAAAAGGGRLTLVRGGEDIQRVLQVSGLEPELEFVDEPDAPL